MRYNLIIILFLLSSLSGAAQTHNLRRDIVCNMPVLEALDYEKLIAEPYVHATYNYFDGEGKIVQQITEQASYSGKNIIQTFEYDYFGREAIKRLPYTYEGDVAYQNSYLEDQQQFYQTAPRVAKTMFPYSETRFEYSALSTPLEASAPGQSWNMQSGNTTSYNISSNTASDVIPIFHVNNDAALTCDILGEYGAGELSVETTTDENDNISRSYTDKEGLILVSETILNGSPVRTFYIYDKYNNLTYVISPMGQTDIESLLQIPNSSFAVNDEFIKDYCYYYKYDYLKRQIEKKLPGKEPEYTIYDNYSRVALTQDGNLRANDLWFFTKYDALDRPVITGTTNQFVINGTAQTRSEIQTLFEQQTSGFYETKDNNHAYTDVSLPHIINNAPIETTILQEFYYDDYRFPDATNYPFVSYSGFEDNWHQYSRGSVTATKTNILGTSDYLTTVSYYDQYARNILTYAENHRNYIDTLYTYYDYPGNIRKTRAVITADLNGTPVSTITWNNYDFDEYNRLRAQYHTVGDNGEKVQIANYVYNELGQMVEQQVHQNEDKSYLQSVDYSYNIRGWLEHINSLNLNTDINIISNLNGVTKVADKLTFNTITFEVNTYNANDTAYLQFLISDDKELIVNETYNNGSTSSFNLGLDEEQVTDTENLTLSDTAYNALLTLSGTELILDFNGFFIDEQVSTLEVIEQADTLLAEALANYNFTNQEAITVLQNEMYKFIVATVGIVFFNDDTDDLFALDLSYDQPFSNVYNIGDPQYNGNISAMKWISARDNTVRGYAYEYDHLNRVTKAEYYANKDNGYADEQHYFDVDNLLYDNNGNILNVQRKGYDSPNYGSVIDDLTYEYDGNRLIGVDDGAVDYPSYEMYRKDFNDNGSSFSPSNPEYLYDENGNMVEDKNKGILVDYNLLNLPEKITFDQNHFIEYLYTADGRKLSKIVTENTTISYTDYLGERIDRDRAEVDYLLHDLGRVVAADAGKWIYEYHLTDHLGNVRVAFADLDEDGDAEMLQENHYYPFGQRLNLPGYQSSDANPYLYNGKELQEDLGLRWYDYGARFYDAQVGRWHVIDNKAEKFSSYTPFNYAINNPTLFIDPDGNEIKIKRIQQEGKKDIVQITVVAKVYNASSKKMSAGDLNNFASLIGDQIISSFGGDYENVTVDVDTNIDVIEDLRKTKGSDHLFIISDATDPDLQNNDGTVNAGASNIGGQVAKINSNIIGDDKQVQRTGAHEFGHMAGLEHPEDESDQNVKDAASNDKNNLMHQSSTSTGTNIVEEQINRIEDENK
ncbi:MAG: DUF6443 domain-containing protein [Bacteroidales bacterium]|nr:DUF6443 domain-containing protein [Bacteroidales bacterium]